jgi:hypothetical protein
MKITTAAVLALLTAPALAQPSQLFHDQRGQITGSASTSDNVTTYRDRMGRRIGTAERMHDGSIQFRDGHGRLTGSATAPRR